MRARFFSLALATVVLTAAPAAAQTAPYAAAVNKSRAGPAEVSRRAPEATPAAAASAAKPAPGAPAVGPSSTRQALHAPAARSVPAGPASEGFVYNPDGRRDPFVSLLRRSIGATAQATAPRRPGLAGLGVAEVTLKGTMASRGDYLGLLQGVDSKTYIVRPGARLLDGVVQAVSADAVVILQHIDDPLSVQKEREVRKTLRQTEEEAK